MPIEIYDRALSAQEMAERLGVSRKHAAELWMLAVSNAQLPTKRTAARKTSRMAPEKKRVLQGRATSPRKRTASKKQGSSQVLMEAARATLKTKSNGNK